MISSLPHDLAGLVLMVFLLGLRHGMDPDHLATVDGLARHNAQDRPRVARWSGCFFSLGHGAIVTLVAAFVAATLHDGAAPQWLERLGAWISIVFLLGLGIVNVVAVFRTPADRVVRLAGFKGRWVGRIAETGHPAVIAVIGAAFAISFDTVSQTALFSLTAVHLAGWPLSVALGLVFTLGMMATDGLNGAWVARMIARADRRARVASRVMGLAIASLGIGIACLGMARLLSAQAAAVLAGAELPMGFGVAIIAATSFAVAMRLARPTAA
ncbi:MAG TPA: nickel transporter [Burkholderiales bacterium]|nr:nickel transporter [Burkholderiales bacterium]